VASALWPWAGCYGRTTRKTVIAIGGWSGADNSPTLSQFTLYVAQGGGGVGYYIVSSEQGAARCGQDAVASRTAAWVAAHSPSTTIGGQTGYRLSPTSS
jgi:hypothetical protein